MLLPNGDVLPDMVGMVINERYQILEPLSRGGMGVVYKARHLALDSLVAVKVLLEPQEPEAQEQFLTEARLASKISHPNTVYIADFGVLPDGRTYLAMEFIAGPTLGRLIKEGLRRNSLAPKGQAAKAGPIDPLRACRIALQVTRGLAAVHDKGIIHRDLKPDQAASGKAAGNRAVAQAGNRRGTGAAVAGVVSAGKRAADRSPARC